MYASLQQNENSQTFCHIGEFPNNQTFFSFSYGPPAKENEDISMFKIIQDKLGISHFVKFLAHMLPLHFYNWRTMQSGKIIDFFGLQLWLVACEF